MATPQTYSSTNDVTIPSSIPRDEGGTLSMGRVETGINGALTSQAVGITVTELDYMSAIKTDANLWEEFQNWIALLCRATVNGLSTGTAALPYASVTPREVMFRLQHMIAAALRDIHPYGM